MKNGMKVKILEKKEFDKWDNFVESSWEGTIFSKSFWAEHICNHTKNKFFIYGVFNKNNEIISGLPIYYRKKGVFKIAIYPPVTPFMGIVYNKKKTKKFSKIESYEKNVVELLSRKLETDFSYTSLSLNPSIIDIRPFKFENWETEVVYTYYIDLSDIDSLWNNMDKACKYDIKKAEENKLIFSKEGDIKSFYNLYLETYSRQNMNVPVTEEFITSMYNHLKDKESIQLYFVKKDSKIIASSIVILDSTMAYYLLAASDPDNRQYKAPSFLLWNILKDVSSKYKEIDLVGANTQSIIRFKRGFATKLVPYFVVSKFSSKIVKFFFGIYNLIK